MASTTQKGSSKLPLPRSILHGTDTARIPTIKTGLLRRRSKSTSDLRKLEAKGLKAKENVAVKKPINGGPLKASGIAPRTANEAPTKPGIKRPALNTVNEEVKPKVAKVKIPEWDYKSRFQELQKKHFSLREELKEVKDRLTSIPDLESELTSIKEENQRINAELNKIRERERSYSQQNSILLKENSRYKEELNEIHTKYDLLNRLYDNLNQELSQIKSNHQIQQEKFEECKTQLSLARNECTQLKDENAQLKEKIDEQEYFRRNLHNTIQDLKGNIRVFCRVRPPVTSDEKDKLPCAIFFPNESTMEIKKSRESVSCISGKIQDSKQEFSFDKAFPPQATQLEIFDELAQLVQSALDGYDVCVFAYGQTGSGKTYTMQGNPGDDGMIPRTVDLIFKTIEKLAISDWTYTVAASFLQIYNENIKDMLVPDSTCNYDIRYNEGRGVTVTNLKIVPITSSDQLKSLMDQANRNRVVAGTEFNDYSSRSHAVTKIYLEGINQRTKVTYVGSINLVDLAGSESAKTAFGERLEETKNINKSLSTLKSVMLALHNKDQFIPYRNSKLTFLLQSCLGGNSKTLMFVNISPFEECFSESVSSLRFASQVKHVKTLAKKNKAYLETS